MITTSSRYACTALALIISLTFTLPASAQVDVGGVTAKVSGTVSGAVGGAGGIVTGAGGTVSGTLGGAGGALGGATGTLSGAGMGSLSTFSGPGGTFNGIGSTTGSFGFAGTASTQASDSSALTEIHQRVAGKILAVTANSVTVRLTDGTTKTYRITADMAALLRGYVGKEMYLRSADGTNITSIVGQNDVIRGSITAINNNIVTFMSPNGEVHTIRLDGNAIAALHLRTGSHVLSVSNDFGKTARLAVLNVSPRSTLANVYVGTVGAVSGHTVTLGIGRSQQQFLLDGRMQAALRSLRSHVVAINSSDGVHVTSLLATPTLLNLIAMSRTNARLLSGAVTAAVLTTATGHLTLQLPNGDVASYGGNLGHLGLHARVPVVITPLDSVHVRIRAAGHIATLADADACVTVNAHCRGAMQGHVVSVSPTALTVRMGNGDTKTFLGNVLPLGVNAGVPVTIQPLDSVHAKIIAGATVVPLLNASACVTINAGCDAMSGTVVGTGPSSLSIRLPNGDIANFSGNPSLLGVTANVPVIVQPLDNTHAVILANGHALQLADANLCVTLNASCPAAGPLPNGGVIATTNNTATAAGQTATAKGCATLNNPGCASMVPSAGTGAGSRPSAIAVANGTAHTARNNANAAACVTLNHAGCTKGSPAGPGTRNPNALSTVQTNAQVARQNATGDACAALNHPGCATKVPSASTGAGRRPSAIAVANGTAQTARNTANAAACVTLNHAGCTKGSPAGPGTRTPNALSTVQTNAQVARQNATGDACAALNHPGCVAKTGNGTPTGNPSVFGTANGAVSAANNAATGNGCVSINGGACVASVPNNGIGGNGGSGGANGGNGGANSPSNPNNPGQIAGPGNGSSGGNDNGGNNNGGGSGQTLTGPNAGGGYIIASIPQLLGMMSTPASCSQDGQVAVNVNDQRTNRPVEGARVQLLGSGNPVWHTGKDGVVRFLRLQTGTYRVQITGAGYKSIVSPAVKVDCLAADKLGFRLAGLGIRTAVSAATYSRARRITPAMIQMTSLTSTTCVGHHHYRSYVARVHRVVRTTRRAVTTYHCTR